LGFGLTEGHSSRLLNYGQTSEHIGFAFQTLNRLGGAYRQMFKRSTKKWLRHEGWQTNGLQTWLADFNSSKLSQAGRR